MVRSFTGYAIFAAVILLGFKLFSAFLGIFWSLLWLAFLGFIFYLILRVFAPGTADKVRDTIKGEGNS